ncbi:MAG: sialate O-acetylesterase [Bacteroidales bacterium]|nr:sialate O-acetylesterase [Bacteroidales bacterium]
MNKIIKILAAIVFLTVSLSVSSGAAIKLPGIIGDHMVLQQQTDARLWGWSAPGKRVSVNCSWNNKTVSTKSDRDGAWEVRVKTPSAGGPYEITIDDGKKTVIKDVLIGEVWLCSGQSNMEMPLEGFEYGQYVIGARDYIASARSERPIRMAQLPLDYSLTPKDDCEVSWVTNSPENLPEISACAVFFGDYLQRVLGVPIGLIITDWGASTIESWMDRESILEAVPKADFSILESPEKFKNFPQQTPTLLFNAMVNPLRKYTLKGLIWYQGESNIPNYQDYDNLQRSFISLWRKTFENPGMPFCFTQIAPFEYPYEVKRAAFLRERQAMSLGLIENASMAVTIDLGEKYVIHPRHKREVAERLALGALAIGYGRQIKYLSPEYLSHEIEGSRIIIHTSESEQGLHAEIEEGGFIPGFEVAGDDKRFYPAQAALIHRPEEVIAISSPEVPKPVAVRYCFKDYQPGVIFNNYGLPLAPFRSDDWDDAKGPVFWW